MIENPFKNFGDKFFRINLDGPLDQDPSQNATKKTITPDELNYDPTPMQRISVAAVVENLLGSSETHHDFPGDRHRFSYQEAKEITEKLKRMLGYKVVEDEVNSQLFGTYTIRRMELSKDKLDFASEKLITLINQVANNDLVGKSVWVVYELAHILSHGFYDLEAKHVAPPKDIEQLAMVISHLVYAVCFLEGNLPPNDLGYIGDETVSLVRKDEIAREESLHSAFRIIENTPDVLGQDSKRIYNKIALRCEARRPKFMGRPVSYEEIKFFDEIEK